MAKQPEKSLTNSIPEVSATTEDSLIPIPPATDEQPSKSPDAKNYETGRKPKLLDRRYLAGLLDGEGCFMILRHQNPHRLWLYYPTIQVTNTDRYVLECLVHSFGGSIVSNGKRKKGWKKAWKWRVTGSMVLPILRQTMGWLVIKRSVARTMFKFIAYKEKPRQLDRTLREYQKRVQRLNLRGDDREVNVD